MGEKGIKIILLGESGVGKTNLINSLFDKNFDENSPTTHNCYCFDGECNINNKVYMYNIWDTAGQEQYRALNKLFVKDSKIVICVYSIDNKESFKEMNFWIDYVKEILDKGKYIFALVGNKSDLYENQEVPDEEGEKLANENGMKFEITSALTDAAGFKKFINDLIKDYIDLDKEDEIDEIKNTSFKVNKIKIKPEKKKQCCEN